MTIDQISEVRGEFVPYRVVHDRPAGGVVGLQRCDVVLKSFRGHSPHVYNQSTTECRKIGSFFSVVLLSSTPFISPLLTLWYKTKRSIIRRTAMIGDPPTERATLAAKF